MRFFFTLTVLLTGFSQFSYSQKTDPSEDVHARLIQGKSHSVIAYAGKDRSFTIDVPFKTSKPSDVPGFITIDKQIVQATLVPADRSPKTRDEKTLLTNYMNYELSYYKKKLKQNYTNLQTEWLTLQGRTFLVWYFNMPENYKLVSRQVYVSTLFGDQVVDLNAPVFKSDDWGKARNLLVKLAGSMKTYDKHLDLERLKKKM
ncbi:MAG: hypothetical protein JST68_11820 [Bacteroidetes bacterium]|nr:hypothetical protein [Bacteroidota bacterium]